MGRLNLIEFRIVANSLRWISVPKLGTVWWLVIAAAAALLLAACFAKLGVIFYINAGNIKIMVCGILLYKVLLCWHPPKYFVFVLGLPWRWWYWWWWCWVLCVAVSELAIWAMRFWTNLASHRPPKRFLGRCDMCLDYCGFGHCGAFYINASHMERPPQNLYKNILTNVEVAAAYWTLLPYATILCACVCLIVCVMYTPCECEVFMMPCPRSYVFALHI